MTVKAMLHEAMAKFLYRRCDVDNVRNVTGFEQFDYVWSGCQTCGGTEIRVRICYVQHDGTTGSYEYRGELGQLITDLTDE